MNFPNILGIFSPKSDNSQLDHEALKKMQESLEDLQDFVATAQKEALPNRGGRVSKPETNNLYGLLLDEYQQVTPSFELKLLKLCTHLAKFNGDISYAVDNVVQLGNTPATISFDASVDKKMVPEMISFLTEAERNIYRGGMNSLQNDLFAQLAINGALSAEAIPSPTIERIEKVVLVAPINIRFKYNSKTYEYDAYQKSENSINGGLTKLNPITYKYYAYRLFDDNPYAIPPFIAALESMDIEKDMLCNMKHIVRKLGLFGFLSVLLTPPQRQQGEKDEAYYKRAMTQLESAKAEIEKGFATGISIGFKGSHEFKVEASNTNITGAKEMMEQITQMKAAGIKQDPLMLGRNFNVAETMARVIMAKLTTQVANYQRIVAKFRADLYYLMLVMGGYKVKSVLVEYSAPMIGDKLRDAQAFAAEITNQITLRDKGIISQQEAAQGIGWEKPHAPKDVDYSVPTAVDRLNAKAKATDPNKTKDKNQSTDPTASGATDYRNVTLERFRMALHRGVEEFTYHDENCHCPNHFIQYAKDDKGSMKVEEFIALYGADINAEYTKAVEKVTKRVGIALSELNEGATVEEVTDKIFFILYKEWGGGFTKAQKRIINEWVNEIYRYFRGDTLVFPAGSTIPKVVFGLHDERALTYFKDSDELYLGKFVTDADTRRRITEFIKENYLLNGTPIGRSPEAIANFQEAFGNMLQLEDWKVRRIIDTSVNMMRNAGAVAYMQQAEVKTFQIFGVNDGLQCGYCRHTNGMQFSVEEAFGKVENLVKSMPEFVKSDKPFVTALFGGQDGLDEFVEMNQDEIEARGISVPPFHCNCRCSVGAVL